VAAVEALVITGISWGGHRNMALLVSSGPLSRTISSKAVQGKLIEEADCRFPGERQVNSWPGHSRVWSSTMLRAWKWRPEHRLSDTKSIDQR